MRAMEVQNAGRPSNPKDRIEWERTALHSRIRPTGEKREPLNKRLWTTCPDLDFSSIPITAM